MKSHGPDVMVALDMIGREVDGNLRGQSTGSGGRSKRAPVDVRPCATSALRLGGREQACSCSWQSVGELGKGGYKAMSQVLTTVGDGMLGQEEKTSQGGFCLGMLGGRRGAACWPLL